MASLKNLGVGVQYEEVYENLIGNDLIGRETVERFTERHYILFFSLGNNRRGGL